MGVWSGSLGQEGVLLKTHEGAVWCGEDDVGRVESLLRSVKIGELWIR